MTEDARGYWDTNSMFLKHSLTPVEREEWEERSAIIQEATGCDTWVADLEAGKVCQVEWTARRRRTALTS